MAGTVVSTATDQATILATALAFHDAGYCVVPARGDGSKAPLGAWKTYQTQQPTTEQITRWFTADGHTGLGLICGAISGNLELLEFEGRAVTDGLVADVREIALASGLADLWHRVTNGYCELTPSGGMHLLYRVDGPVAGNTKLARRPGPTPGTVDVLAETRGEGGFVIVAPSYGPVHPTGTAWRLVNGDPSSIPTITADERDALHILAGTINQLPDPGDTAPFTQPPHAGRDDGGTSPGDDYNTRGDWSELLARHGWTHVYTDRAGIGYWRRPGKERGISASVNWNGLNLLRVFSTSTVLQEKAYSLFGAFAALDCGGDHHLAAQLLRAAGYGTPATVPPPFTPAPPAAPIREVPPGPQQPAAGPALPAADDPAATLLAAELRAQRARRDARRVLDAEDAAAAFREPPSRPTLTAELAIEDEPVTYTVDKLLITGGNALLTAAFKTGKTTLIGELTRALADTTPFLGRFTTTIPTGRVGIFNYELDERQYRRWLHDLGIDNTDAAAVLHLRGYRLPITHPFGEDWTVRWLEDHQIAVWIVDPFARAFTGCGEENSNTDVGVFLDALDVIKTRAGVSELVLVTHTGREIFDEGKERARGATRIDDWADTRWMLTADDDGVRYFSATGRDVDVPEEKLTYDPVTRRLTMGGGSRSWEASRRLTDMVVEVVTGQPGITTRELREAMSARLGKSGWKAIDSARDRAVAERRVIVREGARNALRYYLPGGDFVASA